MLWIIRACSFTLLLLLPWPSFAADLYYCDCDTGAEGGCSAGSNGNAGTSGSPKQTWDQLISDLDASACGDRFFMCEGGAFDTSSVGNLGNAALDCSANPRIVGKYDPGSFNNNPVVRYTGNGSLETPLQLGGFSCSQGKFDGVKFEDFTLLHAGATPPATVGIYQNSCTDNDMILEDLIIDGFNIGINWGGANVAKARLTRVEIRNSWGQGTLGGFGNDSIIEDSTFHHNALVCDTLAAGACGGNHATYLGIQSTTTGVIIRRNHWYNNCEKDGKCACGVMPLRGGDGLIFEDNILDATDSSSTGNRATSICNAKIGQNGTSSESDGVQNGIFRRNKFINFDNVDFEGAQSTTWENNQFIQTGTTFSTSTTLMCIHIFNGSGSGADLPITDDITFRNNSCYQSGSVNESAGFRVSVSEGTSHTMHSNAVHIVGGLSVTSCYDYNAATLSLWELDNNHCHRSGAGTTHFARSGGSTRTLAQWQTALGGCPNTGNECSGITGDPLFANVGTYDLSIPTNSPLKDAGHATLSASEDFDGFTRPSGIGYDIGAFEFGASGESSTVGSAGRGVSIRGGSIR